MGNRRFTRWVRIGLVAMALAGVTAVPMVDSASAAVYSGRSIWCTRC